MILFPSVLMDDSCHVMYTVSGLERRGTIGPVIAREVRPFIRFVSLVIVPNSKNDDTQQFQEDGTHPLFSKFASFLSELTNTDLCLCQPWWTENSEKIALFCQKKQNYNWSLLWLKQCKQYYKVILKLYVNI